MGVKLKSTVYEVDGVVYSQRNSLANTESSQRLNANLMTLITEIQESRVRMEGAK